MAFGRTDHTRRPFTRCCASWRDPTYAAIVDFNAAFDNVSIRKLEKTVTEKFGLRGKIVETLRYI